MIPKHLRRCAFVASAFVWLALAGFPATAQQPVREPVDRVDVPESAASKLLQLALSGDASEELRAQPGFAVASTLARWARAWQTQNPEGYLAEYAADYAPEGASRASWAAQRRQRIVAPTSIRLALDDLEIELVSASEALATFQQTYESERFADVVRKTLRLRSIEGAWKIVGEESEALERLR